MASTFAVRYQYFDGVEKPRVGYVKVQSKLGLESLPDFSARIAREGLHDANAGHSWWVMPGAILSVVELDEAGRAKKYQPPAPPPPLQAETLDRGLFGESEPGS